MLEELGRNILVGAAVLCQLQGNVEHAQTVKCHPSCTVCLLKNTSSRQGLGSVEEADIVQPEETTLKHVLAIGVLAVHPPREIQQKFLENTFKEINILTSIEFPLNLESSEGCPGMDRRVDITKVPFVAVSLLLVAHHSLLEPATI